MVRAASLRYSISTNSTNVGNHIAADTVARSIIHLFVLVSALACVYAIRQADTGFFGYLVYGRLFVEQGGPVTIDPFAYTSSGQSWVPFEYLSQALLWIVYQHFGPIGLIALKIIVGGAAILFVYVAVRAATDDPFIWAPSLLLCTVTVARYFTFRPQLFTFCFFSIFVAIAFRFIIRGKGALWMLPVLTTVWANMHGGFVAGLGVIGLAGIIRIWSRWNDRAEFLAVVGSVRALALTFVGCVLASLVNPQGSRLWTYVVSELTHSTNRRNLEEWMPISWNRDAWSATAICIISSSLIGLVALAPKRRVLALYAWQWLVVSVPVIVLAFLTARNVTIAAIWCAPVLALLRSSADGRRRWTGRVWLCTTAAALVGAYLTLAFVWLKPRPEIATSGLPVLGTTNPCAAARFMRERAVIGNVYTPLWWGSFLTWQLYPAVRVSMDGRNISLFSDDLVRENFAFYGETPDEWIDAPLRYGTDLLLIPSDRPVLSLVEHDARWRQMYADADASLFVRADRGGQLPGSVTSNVYAFPAAIDSCSGTLPRWSAK